MSSGGLADDRPPDDGQPDDRQPDDRQSGGDPELGRLASVNLNLLVPLLAVLEERSVSRAAAKVGLSQPAMSHALRRMRHLLGDELVIRRGNSSVLTPHGAALIAPLRRALRETARIVDSRPFDPATTRRVITVAMTTSTALVIAGELARALADRAPNAVLRLRTMAVASDAVFTDEGADVLLLPEVFASAHPRERLWDDRWVIIASSGAPQDATAVELLTVLPHVVIDGSPQHARLYEILDERKIPYRVRARVSDNLLIPTMVARSGGVAVQGFQIARALRGTLGLRVEDFPFPAPGLAIDMILNPWLHDDGFRTWLRQVFFDATLHAVAA